MAWTYKIKIILIKWLLIYYYINFTEIRLFQSLNLQDGNLKVSVLIKSGYYIVFNPPKVLLFFLSISIIFSFQVLS